MSLVRLYYSSMDVKPGALLRYFLRLIGFYVEEISGDTKESDAVSAADVYIISDAYAEYENNNAETIDVPDESKVIAICKDNWYMTDSKSWMITYDGTGDRKFLRDFLNALGAILCQDERMAGTLVGSVLDCWDEVSVKLANFYLRYKILPMTQYTRCFYRQNDLFLLALSRYRLFIAAIRSMAREHGNPDLLKYTLIYAQYELDLICKRNRYIYYRSPDRLLDLCEGLLLDYEENEQLRLLKADIRCNLQGKWLRAYGEYEKKLLDACAYANYKCGKISKQYAKDYESAIFSLEKAIRHKSDYYKAYYELGECYEETACYHEAAEQYTKVYLALKDKLEKHLLEPIELAYLYRSMVKAAFIKKENEGKGLLAKEYRLLAEQAKKEVDDLTYLKLAWPEAAANEELKGKIREAMALHMDV